MFGYFVALKLMFATLPGWMHEVDEARACSDSGA